MNFFISDPLFKVAIPAGVIIIMLLRVKKKPILYEELLLKTPIAKQALIWTVIFVSYMLLTDLLLNWRGEFDFSAWKEQPAGTSIARILAVGILGPIAEELVFRGFLLLRLLKIVKNRWIAIVVIAIGWGFLHWEYKLETDLLIIIEGVILGVAMVKSKSLYVPIWLHIVWNMYAIW